MIDETRDDVVVSFSRSLYHLFILFFVIVSTIFFTIWNVDTIRAERFRIEVIDALSPVTRLVSVPKGYLKTLSGNLRSQMRLAEQNRELRQEIQTMKAWRERAIRLEQRNAKLLELNKVRLTPQLSYLSGQVMIEANAPFQRSVLVNLGQDNRIEEGWAVMDGLGLVGRIAGVAQSVSRVLLISDPSSQIPIISRPSEQRGIMSGDASSLPRLDFIQDEELLRPGDRIYTSGDGGAFPSDILIGQVVRGKDRKLRVRPFANLSALEYLRVVRFTPQPAITLPDRLIGPQVPTRPLRGISETNEERRAPDG